MRFFIAAIAACALAGCAGESELQPLPAIYVSLAQKNSAADVGAMRDLINEYRRSRGLEPLTVDPQLNQVALDQALAMAAVDKTGHNVGKGDLGHRLRNAGVIRQRRGENISAGYHTVAEAFSGWRESPKHDAIMLKPEIRRMGLGTAYVPNSKYKVFWSLIVTTEN